MSNFTFIFQTDHTNVYMCTCMHACTLLVVTPHVHIERVKRSEPQTQYDRYTAYSINVKLSVLNVQKAVSFEQFDRWHTCKRL